MEKPTGRHRKPVRGLGRRVRWLFGVVLAAVLCSPHQVRWERHVDRHRGVGRPAVGHRVTPEAVAVTSPEVWFRRTGVLGVSGEEPEPGPVRVPRPRRPHPSEQGWCVDDDGVRGVRPYLFRDAERARPGKEHSSVVQASGEFDELAAAVRTWLSPAT